MPAPPRRRRPRPRRGPCPPQLLVCVASTLVTQLALALLWDRGMLWKRSQPSGAAHPRDPDSPASAKVRPAPPAEVRVRVDQVMLSRGIATSVCTSMDWWPPDKCDYGDCAWANASVLTADLSHPLLRNALHALGHGHTLRVGGSLADIVTYAGVPERSATGSDIDCSGRGLVLTAHVRMATLRLPIYGNPPA